MRSNHSEPLKPNSELPKLPNVPPRLLSNLPTLPSVRHRPLLAQHSQHGLQRLRLIVDGVSERRGPQMLTSVAIDPATGGLVEKICRAETHLLTIHGSHAPNVRLLREGRFLATATPALFIGVLKSLA